MSKDAAKIHIFFITFARTLHFYGRKSNQLKHFYGRILEKTRGCLIIRAAGVNCPMVKLFNGPI